MSPLDAVVVRVGDPAVPNSYADPHATVREPVPSCCSWKVIFSPSTGLVGLEIVHELDVRVSRKSLPSEQSTATAFATADKVTTAGARYPVMVAPASSAYSDPAFFHVPGEPPAVQMKIFPVVSTMKSPVENVPDPGAPPVVAPTNRVAVVAPVSPPDATAR